MKLNVDFIDKEDYMWVFENKDIFKRYLLDYFGFREKGLTHWTIKIESPEIHYIKVTLHKAPKLNKIDWMILNCSTDDRIKIGTITNSINISNSKYSKKHPKDLDSIKEETQGTYFKDIMKIIKRDIKLKGILNV